MKENFINIIFSLIILGLLPACQKQGPVELVDDDLQSQSLELDNSASIIDSTFDLNEVDSAGLFPRIGRRIYGQLIVAGTVVDAPFERQEASLAKGIFFNRNQPVVINGDTIGYRSLDVGALRIDTLSLFKHRKIRFFPNNLHDTLGVYYELYNLNGSGGRGFHFIPKHEYRWTATGYEQFKPFVATIMSPPVLRVVFPTPRDVIDVSKNLRVKWEGGGSSVRIIISNYRIGERPRPLFQGRVRVNHGGVIIPSTILQLLPRDKLSFLFTFLTETNSLNRLNGFQDIVLVQASFSHSILLRIKR